VWNQPPSPGINCSLDAQRTVSTPPHRRLNLAGLRGPTRRPSDPSKVQGYPLEDESYGSRSQFETEVRTRYKTATPQSSWTFTPLQNSVGIITLRDCISSAAMPAPR
jgi:hypothetical protein